MNLRLVIMMTVCALSTACSSMEKSILLGAGMGGAAGSAIGNNHGRGSAQRRMSGALIGATVGGIIGYLAHRDKSKKSTTTTAKKNKEAVPLLTRPRVKRIWVKDKVKGKRFVRGHWEYIIEENSQWAR